MTAGTSPSRRVARAAPLPARPRDSASILMVWTMVVLRLVWVWPRSGPARTGRGYASLQGCQRARQLAHWRRRRNRAGAVRRGDPGRPVDRSRVNADRCGMEALILLPALLVLGFFLGWGFGIAGYLKAGRLQARVEALERL